MFAHYTEKTQLLKFSSVYCLCEMKSPQASISASMTGPSCAQEDLANLEKFLCSLRYKKIFPFSIDLRFSLWSVLHLHPYLQKKYSIGFQQ